ncbi:MAG: DUF6572 domain-containing protein [Akkermansiaceae bacterium]
MSIDQPNLIDSLTTRTTDNTCIVAIADHLEWDNREHLLALQNKLNNYLSFIESGEIYQSRPDAINQEIEISICCLHTPETTDDLKFLQFARNTIQAAGFKFSVIINNQPFKIPNDPQ